jgi:hypothetical protein
VVPEPGPGYVIGADGTIGPTSMVHALMYVVPAEDPDATIAAFAIGEPCRDRPTQERYMKTFMRDFVRATFGEDPVDLVAIPLGGRSERPN